MKTHKCAKVMKITAVRGGKITTEKCRFKGTVYCLGRWWCPLHAPNADVCELLQNIEAASKAIAKGILTHSSCHLHKDCFWKAKADLYLAHKKILELFGGVN